MTQVLTAKEFKRLLQACNDESNPEKKDYFSIFTRLQDLITHDENNQISAKKYDLLHNYLGLSPDGEELILALRGKLRLNENDRRILLTTFLAFLKNIKLQPNSESLKVQDKILRIHFICM